MVDYLESDAPGSPSDHRFALPHGFGYRKTKALAQRLLQDEIRGSLKGVYSSMSRRRKLKYINVFLPFGGLSDLLINPLSLGIVSSSPSGENQLKGNIFSGHLRGLNYP